MGLYYYGARFYDPALGRFVSPDTIIPQQQGTQAWDRYAYVNNSPLKYTDPTGNWYYDPGCDCLVDNQEPELQFKENLTYYRYTRPIDFTNTEVFVKRNEDVILGWRIEGSIEGFDINFDLIYFSSKRQFNLFGSFAPQKSSLLVFDFTTGPLYGRNYPDPSSYSGPSVASGGDIPALKILLETDISFSANPNQNGSIPIVAYIGVGPFSPSVGVYSNPSYSVNLIQLVSILMEPIFDLFR